MTTSNGELLARRIANVPRGVITSTRVHASRAENAEIWDVEGRRFVDFGGGIAVMNTGHRHPRVVEAIRRQLDRFTHSAFQVMAYEPYISVAERLNALAPFGGPAKTVLFSTGAEAVENSVKIARVATGRSAVVAFGGAFHGRTAMTMALTGKTAPYKRGYGPLPGEVYHVPFPVPHLGIEVEDSLRAIHMLFKADVEAARIAAIILEPVLGEGGFYVAPRALLEQLRDICDRFGIVLIVDEVQSGFARTGKMFAIEHSEVEPDLVAVAKSIAGGLPLSGVIGRAGLMDAVEPGGLGGTFGGNPLACAAALAVLEVIEEERLLDRAVAIGSAMTRSLERMAKRNDLLPIAHVRGLGAMVAFDLVRDRIAGGPDPAATRLVLDRALEDGLVLLSAGADANVIRLLVPLTATDAVIEEGLAILEGSLQLR